MKKGLLLVFLILLVAPMYVVGFSPAEYPNGIHVEIDGCDPEEDLDYSFRYDFDVLVLKQEVEDLGEYYFHLDYKNDITYDIEDTEWDGTNHSWISTRSYLNEELLNYQVFNYNKCGFSMMDSFEHSGLNEWFTTFKIVIMFDNQFYVSDAYSTNNLANADNGWDGLNFIFHPETKEFTYYVNEFDENYNFFDAVFFFFAVIFAIIYIGVFVAIEPIVYLIGRHPTDGIIIGTVFNIVACSIPLFMLFLDLDNLYYINYLGLVLMSLIYVGKHFAIRNLLPGVKSASIAISVVNVLLVTCFVIIASM